MKYESRKRLQNGDLHIGTIMLLPLWLLRATRNTAATHELRPSSVGGGGGGDMYVCLACANLVKQSERARALDRWRNQICGSMSRAIVRPVGWPHAARGRAHGPERRPMFVQFARARALLAPRKRRQKIYSSIYLSLVLALAANGVRPPRQRPRPSGAPNCLALVPIHLAPAGQCPAQICLSPGRSATEPLMLPPPLLPLLAPPLLCTSEPKQTGA